MAVTTDKNPWIAHARPSDSARLRLFCFPYAGGNAGVYRSWADRMPAGVEVLPVELPGRASRFRDPLCRTAQEVVERATAGLEPYFDRPFAFFGHSMGSLIAFELARHLRKRAAEGDGTGEPVWIFASARRAPQCPSREEPVYDLPDPQLLDKLRDLNGTPEEALQHPELMQMMLPLLRADFQISDVYELAEEEPLGCPISAFGGLGDTEVTREDLQAWAEHTRGRFSLRMFPGDHFFLNHEPDRSDLLRALAQDLVSTGALA